MKPPGSRSAAERLAEVRRSTSDAVIRLAYHAALPVVIDAGLLNLMRVNFFLDPPDVLPFEAGAALLLSSLFREIGGDLYEIDPDVRNVLLIGLQTRYGNSRVRQLALLLEQYTCSTPAWNEQPELEQAQQLTALSFVDPERARAWLGEAHSNGAGEGLGREWFVAMRRRLTAQPAARSASDEVTSAAGQLWDERLEVRLGAVRALAALAQIPDTDATPIAMALADLVQRHAEDTGESHAADAKAALAALRDLGEEFPELLSSLSSGDRRSTAVSSGMAVRPREPAVEENFLDARKPLFFISHASPAPANQGPGITRRERDYLIARFFDDLSENVAELVSRPAGSDPGFIDRGMPGGTRWTDELLEAVSSCQVFISMLSPRYFLSELCGMEWDAFSRRTVIRRSRQRARRSCITPVIWAPFHNEQVPSVIREVERFVPTSLPDRETGSQYEKSGIYGLLRLKQESDYAAIVWQLALHIADLHHEYRVEPLAETRDLRNAFLEH